MPETDTATGLLSLADAQTLHDARLVLGRLAESAGLASWQSTTDQGRYGRAAHAFDVAADAVFDALNTASSYLHDSNADAAIVAWQTNAPTVTTEQA